MLQLLELWRIVKIVSLAMGNQKSKFEIRNSKSEETTFARAGHARGGSAPNPGR
jgi:hypothetical protein